MAEAYTRVSADAQGGGDGVNTDTEREMEEEEDSSFSLEVPLTALGADDFDRGAILGRLRERQLQPSCHSAVRYVCVNRSLLLLGRSIYRSLLTQVLPQTPLV